MYGGGRMMPPYSGIAKKGGMNFKTFSKNAKCLHADFEPSKAERVEAFKLLSQWKKNKDKAAK
jgi:hypothetical protein